MNYIEALQALVDGKKIREKNWDKGKYVYIEDNLIVTDCGDVIELVVDVLEDITKDNWEIYQTEEERLIADGKRFSVFRKCKGHSCQRCSAMNPCLYKTCEELGFKHLLLGIIADDDVTDADIDKLYNAVKGELDA